MKLADRVIAVTGGGRGIGAALCRRFAAEQPRGIAVADLDAAAAERVAREVGGIGVACDVTREEDVRRLMETARRELGAVDVVCSNAGVMRGRGFGADRGGPFADDADWDESWRMHVMAHVYAARAALPDMLERETGYLVNVASAAGLLADFSSQAYSVTKHAAVAFAEWLAIAYAEYGVRVSCVCPQGVETAMAAECPTGAEHLKQGMISPEAVAECVVEGIEAERFLILPHPEVGEYCVRRSAQPDRWLEGMRRQRERFYGKRPAG